MCEPHYRQLLRGEELRPVGKHIPAPRRVAPRPPCSFTGCDKPVHVRKYGYCSGHYTQSRRGQPLCALEGKSRRKRVNDYGYVLLSDGRVEHRAVMEQVLGRPLVDRENVHHKNGIRTDNRPENLELWRVRQPKGQRVDDLIGYVAEFWADEVLQRIEEAAA